ncbi:MAG: ATP-dependent RNA helicase HrpA [Arenicella sp.]
MHASELHRLQQQISTCQSTRQFGLNQRLLGLHKNSEKENFAEELAALMSDIDASQQWVKARQESLPDIPFSDALPINQKREEIAALIRDNQVVVIAGETGSGKTTQIPKICLSLGLGAKGLIGHTQPRRIAARTVATRIAEELNTPLGDLVGYQVRFTEDTSDNTRVKLMTDGVLLAELQRDRYLKKYDVIIIDEAHERSLNIDFLLGLLKRLLKKRSDLKLIITSATIDLEKFSQHFDDAPIMEVSGRTYPVEVIYQPDVLDDDNQDDDADLPLTICRTVERIIDSERRGDFMASGDILVFCTGERDIRDAAKALQDHQFNVDVLPLYARLSMQEQTRVFKPSKRRKVVLATNVAETSITVPGIAYVIDPGLARVSRYNFRSKVQGLPIERISQASANQRMGRCGRVANGVCVRLYSEEDFLQRPKFTEAELLRSNLASVILQMLQLGVQDIQHFPFIDKPDNRLLNDGFKLLEELQALQITRPHQNNKGSKNAQRRLSKIGKTLCHIPVDPKYARILLEANQRDCLHEVLIIIAALSSQDPREWPAEKRQAAQEKHGVLAHPRSDFLSYLNLWETINQQRKALSNKQFKEYCSKNFLSIVRIFEWRDMVGQLSKNVKQLKWKVQSDQKISFLSNADDKRSKHKASKPKKSLAKQHDTHYAVIHQSLLSGLLGNIAFYEPEDTRTNTKHRHVKQQEYTAARGRKLAIFPTSALAQKRATRNQQVDNKSNEQARNQAAKWIVANELMETSRLFALTCAHIEPLWINDAAKHLLRYSYANPEYHEKQGVVKAQRKASLYGLTLQDASSVIYSDIDPQVCRELFIRRALVEGAYTRFAQNKTSRQKIAHFYQHNQRLIQHIESIENKTRRRNLLISDDDIFRLYDERIPSNIVNYVGFEQWRKTAELSEKNVLCFDTPQLTVNHLSPLELDSLTQSQISDNSNPLNNAQFPNALTIQGKTLPLSYHFNPGDIHDGVTISLPIELLAPFPEHIGSWLVPGLLREKCIALIKTLPKHYRKLFAPAANAIDRVLPQLRDQHQQAIDVALHIALGAALKQTTGHDIPSTAWQLDALDSYYLLNYRLQKSKATKSSHASKRIIQSRDLTVLKQEYAQIVSDSLHVDNAPQRREFEREQINDWDFGTLQAHLDYQHQGMTVRAFPMLLSAGNTNTIALRLHESHSLATFFTQNALIDLAFLQEDTAKTLKQSLSYLNKEIFKPKTRGDKVELTLLALAPTKSAQQELSQKLIKQTLHQCCFGDTLPTTREEFTHAIDSGCKQWVQLAIDTEKVLINVAEKLSHVHRLIKATKVSDIKTDEVLEEIKQQVFELFEEHFLSYTPLDQLRHYPRYLSVAAIRLEKINQSAPSTFTQALDKFEELLRHKTRAAYDIDPSLKDNKQGLHFLYSSQPELLQHRIMLREWHTSIFAQQLKTQFSVSEKRVNKHWDTLIQDS